MSNASAAHSDRIDATMRKAYAPSDPSDIDAAELMYPPNPTPWHIVPSYDPDIVAINDVEGGTVFPAVRKELAHRIIEGVNGRECASREDQP